MTKINHRRWSDNDIDFGPFTYAKDRNYRPLALVLSSGDEEYPGVSLRVSGFGHTFITILPQWILRPYREKVHAKSWDASTILRLGRDWYWNIDKREYGFSLNDGHLIIYLGRQTMDSKTEQSWSCFLPWTQWRLVRHSFYGINGEYITTLPDIGKPYKLSDPNRWKRELNIANATPKVSFEFKDYDGEHIIATTKIEEREWNFGTGWFKWLSLFRKSKIDRSLDIRFSSEVGEKKGSWKGGILGHGISMLPNELHEEAFRRYCDEHKLTFIKKTTESDKEKDNG